MRPDPGEAGTTAYRPDIDGLRAVAVLAVVVFHAWPALLPGGFIGVDVFFVISGYLITGIILGGLAQGRFQFSDFYARRIRRIFPALAVVLIASYVAGWFLLFADDYQNLSRHLMAAVLFVSNFLLRGESGYFDEAADRKPLQHLWSLGIEEQFYLIWPALLVTAWRLRIKPLYLTSAIVVFSFFYNVYSVRIDPAATFYSPSTRFWQLLLGGALAAAHQGRSTAIPASTANLMSFTGVGLIAAGLALLDGTRLFPGLWALLPSVGALLMIVAGPLAWFNRTVLSAPVLVGIGLISYPLYLWHWPLLSFARIAGGDTPSHLVRAGLVLASGVLAWLTYEVIEKPVRFGRRRALMVPGLCAAMVAIIGVAFVTDRAGGLMARPITRTDQAQFIQYYDRMHKQGLSEAYRQECDFMDWPTGAVRLSIDPACTEPGERETVFLWGDSYAQALSAGLRAAAPAGTRVAQVATSLCRPSFEDIDPHVPGGRCRVSNHYALERIRALRPAVVVIAQNLGHAETDWALLTREVQAAGAGRVVLVGPAPFWTPSLPEVVAHQYWGRSYARVSHGLAIAAFDTDRLLKARVAGVDGLSYVSLLDGLCTDAGCQAVVDGGGWQDLIAFDSGHFSPRGSVFVGEELLRGAIFSGRR
ncbi:MAG: acyltransferase family protein [Acidobacteriota bacterium]|nr:acyltransferase family protein [Acidobacteriota bacterium]